jgi:hypothetical protein
MRDSIATQDETHSGLGCLIATIIGVGSWVLAFWLIAQARAWWGAHVG